MLRLSKQLTFEFANDLQNYDFDDLVISNSNLMAYKLINSWPNWNSSVAAIIGATGAGKSHFANVWQKMSSAIIFKPNELKEANLAIIENNSVLIENLEENSFIEEDLFHLFNSINQARIHNQNQNILITCSNSPKNWKINLLDLASRLKTIIETYIEQPDDMLLEAILLKLFSDKQIIIDANVLSYIISNMERSFNFAIKLVELCDKYALEKHSKISKQIANIALNELLNK